MNNYSIEELEIIRLWAGEVQKKLTAKIHQYKIDEKISEKKKEKGIDQTNQELAITNLIEAKTMRELSNRLLE